MFIGLVYSKISRISHNINMAFLSLHSRSQSVGYIRYVPVIGIGQGFNGLLCSKISRISHTIQLT